MAYKQLKLWFDLVLAEMLAQKILVVYPEFESSKFVQVVDEGIGALELKDRVAFMAQQLHVCFNQDYKKGLITLTQILGPENTEETGMFLNFYWIMPIAKYVEDFGLPHYEESLKALEEITKRNTSEYAIRPYIKKYPQKTIGQMIKWSKNENFHIRRLASEGGRPRLPWARKLQLFIDDPMPLLPILENLKDDQCKYVQKSVANCLNDILKDNGNIGKGVLESWIEGATPQRIWIMKHAMRNLIKKNDQWALNVSNEILQQSIP